MTTKKTVDILLFRGLNVSNKQLSVEAYYVIFDLMRIYKIHLCSLINTKKS